MAEPAAPEASDVFLSYHRGDSDWVVTLKKALERKGVKVWFDRDQVRPGDRFVEVLERALQSVGSVVSVVSPGSLRSAWVREEYDQAVIRSNREPGRFRLIPVLIGDAEPPPFLGSRDWVDFRDPATFAQSVDQLVFGITGRRSGASEDGAAVILHA